MDLLYTSIGMVGVVINIIAYGMLTTGHLRSDDVRYQITNILGTCGILVSLVAQWNLPSFIANTLWLVIGAVGLYRILRKRARGDA